MFWSKPKARYKIVDKQREVVLYERSFLLYMKDGTTRVSKKYDTVDKTGHSEKVDLVTGTEYEADIYDTPKSGQILDRTFTNHGSYINRVKLNSYQSTHEINNPDGSILQIRAEDVSHILAYPPLEHSKVFVTDRVLEKI